MLSFVPAGMLRKIAEYFVALVPGAVLLFAFFFAAQAAVLLLPGGELLAASFIPVICMVPVLSGVVSTLLLEKVRKKPLTLKRGALVGAASALAGALLSAVMLIVVFVVTNKPPFGSTLGSLVFYLSLPAIVALDSILGALGGALVVKFISFKEA
jgi:hypothetical protein